MYTIITIIPDKQDPAELGIWVEELKKKHWQFSEFFPNTCWKKFESNDLKAYKEEFDAAVVNADLVKDHYMISYSQHSPAVEVFTAY